MLGDLISSDQKGFLKGRYVGENTRLVYEVMSYLKEQDKNGMLLLIDFEKAFDTLSWKYILLVEIQDTYNIEMHIAKWSKQKQYEEFEEKLGVLEGIML